MATFTVTTNTNYSSLSGIVNGDSVTVSEGARFTINTSTVRLVTVECTTLGEIYIENTSTSTPIFVNIGVAATSGVIRAQGGGKLTTRGNWITIGTSNGSASQTFNTPTDALGANYSRLGGVWVNGKWWPTVLSLTDTDTDETGEVCVHNTTLNRIEFSNGTDGKIPPNGATIQIPNTQVRYSDTSSTARAINIDLYTTGTADFRILALDGYVGAAAATDFLSNASQFDWDRVCMDVGSNGNTTSRWHFDSPDSDSSMTDVCFSRTSGSTNAFQFVSSISKYTLTRVTFMWPAGTGVTISGNSTRMIDCKWLLPGTNASQLTVSGRQMYIRGLRYMARATVTISGTQSVIEDFRMTNRTTRTGTPGALQGTLQLTGEGCVCNGFTDWKASNQWNSPATNMGMILLSGLDSQLFNLYAIGDTGSSQGRVIMATGRGCRVYDAAIIDNAPRGNILPTGANQTIRNIFSSDTSNTASSDAVPYLPNNVDSELMMTNYRTSSTRILNGVSTASQGRYIGLTPSGIGSDVSTVLMLRNDIGRSGGMILTIFGLEKSREFYTPDAGNTGEIFFTNDGKVWIANSGDRFVLTGRRHYGITAWSDILLDGTNPLNFTIEFRAAEGTNAHTGAWAALTTANLTSATSGFADMKNNGVTLQYRITHNASNLTDNLNIIEVRCTVDNTFSVPYVVSDIYSSGDYSLHKRLDMNDCRVNGTLTFTTAGTYYLTDCAIGAVANTSGGNVVINPLGSTSITTNLGPNITINAASTTLTIAQIVSGSRLLIRRTDTMAVLYNDIPGTSYAYSYVWSGDVPVEIIVRKASSAPYYQEWKTTATLAATSNSINASQQPDE